MRYSGVEASVHCRRRGSIPLRLNKNETMKTKITEACIVTLLFCYGAQAAVVVVPGTSDPWLAGMPNGTPASSGDVAPTQSPVLVTGIAITPGSAYRFAASGAVGNDPAYPTEAPDGNAGIITPHVPGAENGIADLTAPLNSLVGIFLGVNRPDLSVAPGGLDFTTAASRDFLTLSPALQQPFFIGDGLTSGSIIQQIIAPTGATRLFLGTMDGAGWYNNPGSFTVTVVPEPTTAAIVLAGILSGCFYRRNTKRSTS